MTYEKLEMEDVKNIGTDVENRTFMEKYNCLVDDLNKDIDKLNALYETYGIKSILDTCGFNAQTAQNFEAEYSKLFAAHSRNYEEYMDMQSEMILANARETIER